MKKINIILVFMYYEFIINFCIVILKMCTLLNSFSVINTGICFFLYAGRATIIIVCWCWLAFLYSFFKRFWNQNCWDLGPCPCFFFITFYKNFILLEVPKINVLKKEQTSLSLNGMYEFIQGDKSSLKSYMIAGSCGGTAR